MPHSYQKENKNVNIPPLRFPMILRHFDLEESQAMHISESYSEGQLQLQLQEYEMPLDEYSLMVRVHLLCLERQ